MDDHILLVGLGNPGIEYENNRHNLGFRVVDGIAARYFLDSFKKIASIANISSANFNDVRITLAKPQTFMNLSGRAVRFLMDFYKISLENIYVFHDDIDLHFGCVKIKQGGSSGGHNGLKSLDSAIGNNYWRIRIGVDRPPEKSMISSYVLSNFEKEQEIVFRTISLEISENISLLFSDHKQLEMILNSIPKA
jgi:PTH1 family peptidyl-tRNA hydrolase